ncbi:hypothetical protein [Hymenobacter psychrotolerans]|uniref:DUF3575 domain-containing protein n=1 Tax=Hymenobacter psychrotolerans DSM 18569 TaxID=1121959 RepID=A0A1M7DHF3_9BACT|nr:hypothetical protein [Hymenobacter psychrotolerans]SHL78797.1 hypothetical protein SAMN02746009_03380 [Hymenobacter psychrotolerans DSM 18569]
MRLYHCLIGTGLLLRVTGAAAQESTFQLNLLLKAAPQHLVMSGYWLEVERRWNQQPRHSLIVTPQLYAGPTGQPDMEVATRQQARNETVRGAGLQVQHRWYIRASKAVYPAGLYVSAGPVFQRFAVSHDEQGWTEVLDPTGLPRYEYRDLRRTETISRYGASAQLGYQAPLPPGRVFLDLYVGAGWRTSRSREGAKRTASGYRSGPSDYGHAGFYIPAGFKVGVALR